MHFKKLNNIINNDRVNNILYNKKNYYFYNYSIIINPKYKLKKTKKTKKQLFGYFVFLMFFLRNNSSFVYDKKLKINFFSITDFQIQYIKNYLFYNNFENNFYQNIFLKKYLLSTLIFEFLILKINSTKLNKLKLYNVIPKFNYSFKINKK